MADKDTNVPNKNDFISREAALELIDNAPIIAGNENETLISAPKLSDKVYCLPAADVVEVVRCKECKYYTEGKLLGPTKFCYFYKIGTGLNTADDDFCSKGERREPQMLKNASQNADADVMMPAT